MGDSYRHTKYKTRPNKKQEYKSTTIRRKGGSEIHCEIKTPPLQRRTSIEDLMKKRESIQEELNQIPEYSIHKGKTRSEDTCDLDSVNLRYNPTGSGVSRDKRPYIKQYKDLSPKPNQSKLDSEDEEELIEERRKQRRIFLNKFRLVLDDHNMKKKTNDNEAKSEIIKDKEKVNVKVEKPVAATKIEVADMFSENDDFGPNKLPEKITQDNISENTAQLNDNWDDSEGYYNITTGDIINNNKYKIMNLIGKGVFANVVRAEDLTQKNTEVAIKIIRNNLLMHSTGVKEMLTLKQLREADPDDRYHCVKYLGFFMHKNHLCIVLEPLYMDLRSALKKYGGNYGLNMKAVMCYTRQLILALRLLKKIDIVHADIKPDNILINEKKNILKLCDFGSAAQIGESEPTPYLVSRFYRAPEIILGIPYKHEIDMWSTGCTVYELATGRICFTGGSNNKMLKCFMDLKGRMSSRMIKRGKFKDQHFNYNNNFLLHKKDEANGREKLVEILNVSPTRDLKKELSKYCKNLSVQEKKLGQLRDLLEKMFILDPNQRATILDCIKHPFIQEDLHK